MVFGAPGDGSAPPERGDGGQGATREEPAAVPLCPSAAPLQPGGNEHKLRTGSGIAAAPMMLRDERCGIEIPLWRGWALSIYRCPPPLGSQRDPSLFAPSGFGVGAGLCHGVGILGVSFFPDRS